MEKWTPRGYKGRMVGVGGVYCAVQIVNVRNCRAKKGKARVEALQFHCNSIFYLSIESDYL